MPSVDSLLLFLGAAVLFAVVPGPAVFYIVTRSVSEGRRSGVISTMAVASGKLVHVAAAAVGISALLASSATAFAVIKYLGAGYLIYLGVRTILQRDGGGAGLGPTAPDLSRAYRDGFLVEITNPKSALFVLAFLPQFVDPAHGAVWLQIALLGVLLVLLTTIGDCGYALVAGTAGMLVRRRTRAARAGQLVSGGTYIALGVTAALAGDRPTHALDAVGPHRVEHAAQPAVGVGLVGCRPHAATRPGRVSGLPAGRCR